MATEQIDKFRKHLVNCCKLPKAEVNFIFEINAEDWISTLVLVDSHTISKYTILCGKGIGSFLYYSKLQQKLKNKRRGP